MKNKFKLLLVLVMMLCVFFSFTACEDVKSGSGESESSSQVTESSSDESSSQESESSSDESDASDGEGETPTAKYTVTFVNYDDSIISSAEYEEGATVVIPTEIPEKPADETYTYTFKGWMRK